MFHVTPVVDAIVNAKVLAEVERPFSKYTTDKNRLKILFTKFILEVFIPSLQFVCVCTPRTFNWKKLFSVERLYLACISIVMENFQ